jgi:hypothetical protein
MYRKKFRADFTTAFIARLPETIRSLVRVEERELSKWQRGYGGGASTSLVCVFTDVLPDETKEGYFARKGLSQDLEYLSFITLMIVRKMGSYSDIRSIIPEDLGGHKEWTIRDARPGPLPGTWVIPYNERGDTLFIPTTKSKAEYYAENPLRVEDLLMIIEHMMVLAGRRRDGIMIDGTVYIDHLIPGGEWNLPDRSVENTAARKEYEEETREAREKERAKKDRVNALAKARRDKKKLTG